MDKFVLFNFTIALNDRIFKLSLQPGTPWEDVQVVLDQFKQDFSDMQKEQEQLQAQQPAPEKASE